MDNSRKFGSDEKIETIDLSLKLDHEELSNEVNSSRELSQFDAKIQSKEKEFGKNSKREEVHIQSLAIFSYKLLILFLTTYED